MSVLTPAPPTTAPATARRAQVAYRTLTPQQRHVFDLATEQAETATPADIHGTLNAWQLTAAALDLHLPTGAELVRCDCDACPDDCDLIVNLDDAATYLDETGMQRVQCADCAADHRHTGH